MRNKELLILLITLLAVLTLFITPTEALAVPIQSLNNQTGQTQTFQNDTNVTISSSNNIHSLGWLGLLPLSRGGTGASSFTLGSLMFSNGTSISQDNSNLFWDNTNKRLGIGTSSPTSALDVSGNINTTSLISTGDLTVNSMNIGRGGGNVSTNTSVGITALLNTNSSSYYNTAIGFETLNSQVTGHSNTAVGAYAMTGNGSNAGNTAIGANSLEQNLSGNGNVGVGTGSLQFNNSGSTNVALGAAALYKNDSGSNNIAIGLYSGTYQANGSTTLTSPENSIYIGSNVKGYDNNDSNSIVIGDSAISAGANKAVIGNSGMTDIYFGSSAGLANTHATTVYSGSSSVPGCIVMGDTSGGVGYVTLNSGVLTVSSTKPSACQ